MYIPEIESLKFMGFWNVGEKDRERLVHSPNDHLWKYGYNHEITWDGKNWYTGDYTIYPKNKTDIMTLVELFTD